MCAEAMASSTEPALGDGNNAAWSRGAQDYHDGLYKDAGQALTQPMM